MDLSATLRESITTPAGSEYEAVGLRRTRKGGLLFAALGTDHL
jgi:hypothetical protein